MVRAFRLIAAALALVATMAGPGAAQAREGRPLLIAHRGLSGEYPEHTLKAYEAAIAAGADYIEPDLVLTMDGVLIARHENALSDSTDIADRPEFADRKKTKVIDGHSRTDWFSEDFTLAEIKTLRARERLPQFRPRSAEHDGRYEIPTFAEIVALQVEENKKRKGNLLGIYPETKNPGYFEASGLSHDAPLIAALAQWGLDRADSPVLIQSFETGNLKGLAGKTDMRLIQLLAAQGGPADRPDMTYEDMATPQGLARIARYAHGIGVAKSLAIPVAEDGAPRQPTALIGDAHAAGLVVHGWTFRRENGFLPPALRSSDDAAAIGDLASELRAFAAAGIDGLFTDNMPEAVAAFGE